MYLEWHTRCYGTCFMFCLGHAQVFCVTAVLSSVELASAERAGVLLRWPVPSLLFLVGLMTRHPASLLNQPETAGRQPPLGRWLFCWLLCKELRKCTVDLCIFCLRTCSGPFCAARGKGKLLCMATMRKPQSPLGVPSKTKSKLRINFVKRNLPDLLLGA